MSELFEIRARIRLLRQQEGGRHSWIKSGYRPAFYMEERQSDGAIFLGDRGCLWPGEECEARIRLTHPEAFGDALKLGASFEFKEGLKLVGRGKVLELHGPDTSRKVVE
jgi:translation elongation factor EF-Tu-like GTPase